jgi:uncharacterized protein (TIGR02444 family)
MTDFPAHPAWDFAVRLYGAPGVAPACLELQERHGIDVTLMLFCLWLGTPVAARLPVLMQASKEWRASAVAPIRAARRWLKSGVETAALYQAVLKAEIDCEHGELLALARLAEAGPALEAGPASAAENLAAFLDASGVRPGEADQSAIAAILAATEIGRIPRKSS